MELAHKYIDGLASDSEIREIKERLKTDAKFRKEFMRLQAMKAMLKADAQLDDMRSEMSTLFDEVVQPKLEKAPAVKKSTKVINLQRVALAVAAAVSLVLVATFVFNNSSTNTESLYQAYYSPYNSNVLRGEGSIDAIYQEAANQYSLGNYGVAQKQLNEYLEKINQNQSEENTSSTSPAVKAYEHEHIYLLLGNCALNLQDTDAAQDYFTKVLNGSNGQFIHDAKWYLALTYLKSAKDTEAENQLRELASTMNLYQIEAKKLLEKWNR